jgi:hypothetical protein
MLKLTGFKKINDKNVFVKDSKVATSLYLTPMGKINLDIHYIDENSNEEVSREFISIDRSSLSFNPELTDPYEQLIDAVEALLISSYYVGEGLSAEKI